MVEVCPQCHKIFSKSASSTPMNEQLIFCGDKCFDSFLQIYSEYFNQQELEIRKKLAISDESSLEILSDTELCEQILEAPLETSTMDDCRGHSFYVQYGQVKHLGEDHYIVIAYTIVNDENIFLFLGASSKREFAHNFLFKKQELSEQQEDHNGLGNIGMNEKDFLTLLDHKKSVLLAQLMEKVTDSDFTFSEYIDYMDDGKEVFENPDELFAWVDEDGDSMYTYSKIMQQDGQAYYYIIIALLLNESAYPILTFPSRDQNLLQLFQRGEREIGQISN